jgi:biopolymer transport protein ExbD
MPGNREIKTINAAPMADIAFLLLIFFLVTTTLDTDSGILRKLPAIPEEDQEEPEDKIRERNVYIVLINKNDDLLVEFEQMNLSELRKSAKEFISNPLNLETLPQKTLKEVPFFGMVEVCNKGVISLQNDRGTSYGMYIKVQNELVAAYNELRNELALQRFGSPFDDLDKEQSDAVVDIYPLTLSEAEPKAVGGSQ